MDRSHFILTIKYNATMCSAASWRCCSKRSWSDAGNFSDWATLRKISGWFPREGRPCTIFFLSAGTWGPEDTQWLLAQGHNWPLPTELVGHCEEERTELMTRHNVPLGRILGIPIGLDYSWFLIFALLTWMLAE